MKLMKLTNKLALEPILLVPNHVVGIRFVNPWTGILTSTGVEYAVSETPEEVARMLAEAMESPTLPAAGTLAEVAQRLVDAINAFAVFDDHSVGFDDVESALSAAAALGIVPGGAK